MTTTDEQRAAAYAAGVDAATAAASWTCDGNSDPVVCAALLRDIEDGDPAVWDRLPARPDLSGEWADSPTPQSLAGDILGADWDLHGNAALDYLDEGAVAELADAFELGVDETFETACEAELRRVAS